MKTNRPDTIDRLLNDATSANMSRRDFLQRASALGLGASGVALLAAASSASVNAQGEMTLAFDAAATAGGGGKPGSPISGYSYILNGGGQFEVNRMVDARLITVKPDLSEQVGDLAESWDVDGDTFTFHLNPNATWHDDTPVTSKDVAFTLNLICNPATTSRWANNFANVKGFAETRETFEPLEGFSTPDDQTFVIQLTQPDAGMLVAMNFVSILPEHILGSVDPAKVNEDPFWIEGRIGAGPFKWETYVESERIELVAHEGYHHGAPEIKKLVLLYFSSPDTSLAAFSAGDSLAAPMTSNDVPFVEGIEGAEIVTTPAGVGAIFINVRNESFADKRVRQAVAYAIDKNTITETLFGGSATPVFTEVPYLEWAQPDDANPYEFDPEKARELLAEAEYDSSQTHVFWYYYPDQVTQSVMEAMQQYLADVGITTEIRFDDGSGARVKELEDKTWVLTYGSLGAQPDPSNMNNIFGPAGFEIYGYENQEYLDEMAAALKTYDQAERGTHYQNAIRILNDECPWVWLYNRQNLIAVNTTRFNTGGETSFGPGHILYLSGAEKWTVTD